MGREWTGPSGSVVAGACASDDKPKESNNIRESRWNAGNSPKMRTAEGLSLLAAVLVAVGFPQKWVSQGPILARFTSGQTVKASSTWGDSPERLARNGLDRHLDQHRFAQSFLDLTHQHLARKRLVQEESFF